METPMLRQLMAAYFYQDWDLDNEDEWSTVDEFLTEEPGALAIADEIDLVLHRLTTEQEIADFLESAGSFYTPAEGGSYRAWLTQLAAYAREASA